MPGAKAFVPRRWPTAEQAIDLIQEAGGIAVIAHPYWDIADPGRGGGPDPLPRRPTGSRPSTRPTRRSRPSTCSGLCERARPDPHRLLGLPRPNPQDLLQVRRLRHLRPRPSLRSPPSQRLSATAPGLPTVHRAPRAARRSASLCGPTHPRAYRSVPASCRAKPVARPRPSRPERTGDRPPPVTS